MNKYLMAFFIAVPLIVAGWNVSDADAKGASSLTYSANHSVKRSDNTSASMNERHEFRGGSHVYFAELDVNKRPNWLKDLDVKTYKKGWVRLYLDWPARISRIVIHKASVGKKDFKGGYVELEVQGLKGRWTKVFERKDDDVDRAVTIRKGLSSIGQIKGARLRFKSPAPITIGPIDIK